MARVDNDGSTVTIKPNGIICVDGMQAMKLVFYRGEPWLQFYDKNKVRCRDRGDVCIEVPLDVFFSRIVKICERKRK